MYSEKICHLCKVSDWETAQAAGSYEAASLDTEGFIHCSRPDQVIRVSNLYFHSAAGLLLLWIDPARVTETIRWEPVEGDTYPHIYGILNLDAVIKAVPLTPRSDGSFAHFPEC
jgi:uncharacterized protein (DUF952 family)